MFIITQKNNIINYQMKYVKIIFKFKKMNNYKKNY